MSQNDYLSIGNWRHQCLKQITRNVEDADSYMPPGIKTVFYEAIDDLQKAIRFVLPAGMGNWYEINPEIDFTVDRLPFSMVAFEYGPAKGSSNNPVKVNGEVCNRECLSSKRIILAKQEELSISLRFFFYADQLKQWVLYPFGTRLSNQVCEKPRINPASLIEGTKAWFHNHRQDPFALGQFGQAAIQRGVSENQVWLDVQEESHVVTVVLEMLGCKNVTAEKVTGRQKTTKKMPGALKDDYYKLCIINSKDDKQNADGQAMDGIGSDRSRPSEHLRRGHTYRPRPGIKMWRQGCVVNPGIGRRVEKDYEVRI